MKRYHKNPRKITRLEQEQLTHWLTELGDLSGIVHDLNSDEIIGGNQRGDVFDINKCQIELVQQLDAPDAQGTIAHGFIVWQGARYAYRQVRWTPEQCERANIVANKAGGDWDIEILLAEFERSDLLQWGFDDAELDGLLAELGAGLDAGTGNGQGDAAGIGDGVYSRKIEAPIYEPKGEKPAISQMFDDSKTRLLIAEIDASDLPENEKAFLRIAAQRHTVINFKMVAEYYAHSAEPMQDLMENSALVIIDFDKAIELGYVKLSEQIAEQYAKDYGTT